MFNGWKETDGIILCRSVMDVIQQIVSTPENHARKNSSVTEDTEMGRFQDTIDHSNSSKLLHPCIQEDEIFYDISLRQNVFAALACPDMQQSPEEFSEYEQTGLMICDLGDVHRQYIKWSKELPMVRPFYAVKCNPDRRVVTLLSKLGAGFDCASKSEIDLVLSLDVNPSNIVYANPCKPIGHIKFAAMRGVRMMTFDNVAELYKIEKYHPTAKLILRIRPDDSKSIWQLGLKFGATIESVPLLLKKAVELKLEVIGISFHVGSGCYDVKAFADALLLAQIAFALGKQMGIQLWLLDIGGGFPGNCQNDEIFPDGRSRVEFESITALIRSNLALLFPDVTVIAEPGRYFVTSAYTLICSVTSRRVVYSEGGMQIDRANESIEASVGSDEDGQNNNEMVSPFFMYYINEGIYGSLNCIIFDLVQPCPIMLTRNGKYVYRIDNQIEHLPKYSYSMWGQTCDSIDCIVKLGTLPEIFVGDWLMFRNMGAYTCSSSSNFNGFMKSRIIHVNTERQH